VDYGHDETEKLLRSLERRIKGVYTEAAKELQKTIDEYLARFIGRDEEMRESMERGEISAEQYQHWRLTQIARGERYETMRDELAERATKANEAAVAYVNDATPGIYSLNRNYTSYVIEQAAGDCGFTLFDEQTVKRLITEQPDLMPHYPEKRAVRRGIDLEYGKKQITAGIRSGILQGKPIRGIADDLQKRITSMNRASAIRTARTAVTAAQNAGRQDGYEAAAKLGIKVRKRWIATKDSRTRHDHGMADGQIVEYNEMFKVGGYELAFPGDHQNGAPGWLIYNCRCTMATVEKNGIEAELRQMRVRNPATGRNELVSEMSYEEWVGWKAGLEKIWQSDIIDVTEAYSFAQYDSMLRHRKRVIETSRTRSLPEREKAHSISDFISKDGTVKQRRVYGADGRAVTDYDTSDHKRPKHHPTGAHKHVYDYSKDKPHGSWQELSETELAYNSDIIREGENYHARKTDRPDAPWG